MTCGVISQLARIVASLTCAAALAASPLAGVASTRAPQAHAASQPVPGSAADAASPAPDAAARDTDGGRARLFTKDGFAVSTAPYAYRWPRDFAAHPAYESEWWYFTGHLRAKDGRRFGFELTFFRVGMRPGDPKPGPKQNAWWGHELYPAHFAITDERGKTFFHTERFAREALGMGSASSTTLAVANGPWSLDGRPAGRPDLERMTLRASANSPAGRQALDLIVMPEKPPAVHGTDGISVKSSCPSCASHYYSFTRLATRGTIVSAGTTYAVDGISWMDREYGSGELRTDQAGWDWFSLQLDDRREVMLYDLREKNGSTTPQSSGSLVAPNGTVRHLPLAAFSETALGTWKSPHTSGTYPSGWHVRIPSAGIDAILTPTVLDQELADPTTRISYWEGAVDVRDAHSGRSLGVGYVELTGYAGAISF